MKQHFIKLFNYDRFANHSMLEAMISAEFPSQAVRLMAHLLASQQVWLQRCKDPEFRTGPLWPESDVQELQIMIENNHSNWIQYLEELKEDHCNDIIHYVNANGDPFSNPLSDITAHVINHGTHHRAQIGQQLKAVGVTKLPVTDYIFYLRQ